MLCFIAMGTLFGIQPLVQLKTNQVQIADINNQKMANALFLLGLNVKVTSTKRKPNFAQELKVTDIGIYKTNLLKKTVVLQVLQESEKMGNIQTTLFLISIQIFLCNKKHSPQRLNIYFFPDLEQFIQGFLFAFQGISNILVACGGNLF